MLDLFSRRARCRPVPATSAAGRPRLLSDQVEELEGVEFRKHSRTSARDRARVEAEVIDRLQRYLTIEEILDVDSGAWRPFRPRLLTAEEDGEALGDTLRERWKLGVDPIPNMTSLLEDRGIKVLVVALPEGVSGLTCLVSRKRRKDKVPVIVVNQQVTLERRRLTLAHELAHRLIDSQSPLDQERTANIFAGAFLVPRAHLVQEIGSHRTALGYRELLTTRRASTNCRDDSSDFATGFSRKD